MPHIVVKMFPGRDAETKKTLTKKIEQLFIDELGSSPDSLSIGIEEVDSSDWMENVAKPEILGKKETITKMPGYEIK
jgi:4-oxalocrotonate tautomerase